MSIKSPPVTPEERLYRIVEDGLCIGCGLCEAVAGEDIVKMERVDTGYDRPVVQDSGDALTHEIVDRIYDTCPGTRVEGLPAHLVDETTQHDQVWGPYQRMALGYATDPDIRFRAATGGVLTALAQYLLASKQVAFILHAKPHETTPTFGEAHISFTPDDVLRGMGSRYGPTAPLVNVINILERGEPFAFIGKPCDLSALRNLALFDDRVNKLVKYYLTPVCGGFMPPASMDRFLTDRAGVSLDEIATFRYRGHGCPGKTRMDLKDGSFKEFTYTDMWGEDESQWSLPFRCKICPDGIGESADIAASDTWPGGSPDPATEDDDLGTNALVIRTKAGLELAIGAQKAGFLTLEEDVTPRYMDAVQPHQLAKKLSVRARHDGLAAEGALMPRTARLRLDELNATFGEEPHQSQFEGTRQRVRDGKNAEPTPKVNLQS